MLTITRTRANWERFTSLLEEFQNSNTNQVGHRGPASNTGREHADDIVTTNSPNLVTLDSSVEEVSKDEISVVQPRAREARPPARAPPSPARTPPASPSLLAAPILPILPIIPLPHTIMPDLSRLRMSPTRPATAAAAPSPSTSPTSSPPPLSTPDPSPEPSVRYGSTDVRLRQATRTPNPVPITTTSSMRSITTADLAATQARASTP